MNVIFIDFDGVLNTIHGYSDEVIEKRVEILGNICKQYNAKVIIESSSKEAIDENTMEVYNSWIKKVFSYFKKYNIDCIGRTPTIAKKINAYSYIDCWKEDEIRLYLYRHPEIEHYCVIDDDDLGPKYSDLNKVRDHLVKTIYYSKNPEEEGLLENHQIEIGKALSQENEIKKLILRKNRLKRGDNYGRNI